MSISCKAVVFFVTTGLVGSFVGWYWEEFIDCLNKPVYQAPFGPALMWCVLASFFVLLCKRLFFKD